MATRPDIILAAGQINDPGRLAESQMAQLQLQQARQAMAGQNALRQLFAQPGAIDPNGQVSSNALAQIMRVDPTTGMDLMKQNRQAQLDQLHIKAAELGNQMSQTELGKAKWDWMTDIAAATTDAYDEAIKGGADKNRAMAAATEVRDRMLKENGGQMSDEDEQKALSRPLNLDEARAMAGQNKTWLAKQKEGREEKHETFMEGQEERRTKVEEKRADQDLWTATPDGMLLNKKTGQIRDPDQGGFGGSSGGATTGGLTPRKSAGGDNSDEVVDKKIDFIAAKLGVSPDDKLTPAQLAAFRSAYITTEGSKTNNVGNLKNASGRGFQSFASRDQGMAAITAQISRDYARGQTSIRQLIEGVPKGGGGRDENLVKAIANYDLGIPARLLGTRRGQRLVEEALKINPNFDQTVYGERQKAMRDFGTGAQGNQVRTMNVAISHLSVFERLAQGLQNNHIPLVNAAKNWLSRNAGYNNVTNFDSAKHIVGTELTKAIMGGGIGAGALTDREEAVKEINSARSWQQLAGTIATWKELLSGQLQGLKGQYESSTGRNDFYQRMKLNPVTLHELGVDGSNSGGGDQSASAGWKIVKVSG